MDAPVGWSCERGAVGRYGGVGRLAAAWEVTVGVTSVGDAGVHRGLSPTAARRGTTRATSQPRESRLGVRRRPGPPGRLPVQGHPAAGARPARALGRSARRATSGSSRPRASRRRQGEPRRSGFRFFVTPLSPVFVPNLASCQLDFLSTSNV